MEITWDARPFCDGLKRHRLYIDGQETRYFIDEAHQIHHRTYGQKYGLYGAGMGQVTSAGYKIAGVLGAFDKISEAKRRAVALATAPRTPSPFAA